MAEIKAIETFYNGYRFRSRLEARWAVFFDDAGIKYQYEPEGFKLPNGAWYLPDFYLPWFDLYLEVKPTGLEDHVISQAKDKLESMFSGGHFGNEENGFFVGLLIGDPLEQRNKWILCNYSDDEGGGCMWFPFYFCEGAWYKQERGFTKHCVTVVVGADGYSDEDTVFYNSAFGTNGYVINDCEVTTFRDNFTESAKVARQARFEHGECG